MSDTKVSLSLAKQKLFHMIKLIGKPGKEHPSVSSPVVPYEPPNIRPNLFDAESKKARALMYWRMSRLM